MTVIERKKSGWFQERIQKHDFTIKRY